MGGRRLSRARPSGLDGLLLVVGEERVLAGSASSSAGASAPSRSRSARSSSSSSAGRRREQRGEPGRLVVDRPARPVLEERVELAAVGEAFDLLAGERLEGRPSSRSCGAARFAGAPVPAGISLPMMTFSLSPIRWSLAPLMAASVSTRVVSWKDAAARKLEVLSEAFVTPSRTVWAVAGSPPSARTRSLASSNSSRSMSSVGRRSTSPGWSMRTLRSICRTMISMCLSLIVTPWLR